jgi:ABC-type nickel/cobalt efflux system permease component RcnA
VRQEDVAMDFEFLFQPVEAIDEWLSSMLDGAPLVVALAIAFVLGLRHATDPDHLVAVTSLVAADRGDTRRAAALGAWWGLGHGGTLLVVGVPLILLKSEVPVWLELGAERAVGVVILLLAARVLWKWLRGDYRVGLHSPHRRRHVYRPKDRSHDHGTRSPRQAFTIGLLHGLAGTGAVVLLLIAALQSQLEAGLALLLFAPMSVLSMAACTTVFAWALTRPVLDPVYRSVLIPGFSTFGLLFGTWYVGLL